MGVESCGYFGVFLELSGRKKEIFSYDRSTHVCSSGCSGQVPAEQKFCSKCGAAINTSTETITRVANVDIPEEIEDGDIFVFCEITKGKQNYSFAVPNQNGPRLGRHFDGKREEN